MGVDRASVADERPSPRHALPAGSRAYHYRSCSSPRWSFATLRPRILLYVGVDPFHLWFHQRYSPLYNATSMRAWLRKSWPYLKALLALAILIAIGRQFVRDLGRAELWQQRFHPGWLAASAVLYLLGLAFSAVYWYRLLVVLGQEPSFVATVRAHYIGQMGKYLPGKAWALFLRSNLIRSPTTHVGVAVLTSFYEVFITMS